jgi:hypothetical protein
VNAMKNRMGLIKKIINMKSLCDDNFRFGPKINISILLSVKRLVGLSANRFFCS